MKILGICGSPRKKKHSSTLVRKALEGAASLGAETDCIHLYDYTYKGCISCFSCKKPAHKSYGKCVVKDEIAPLLRRAMEADGLVFGTPVYYGAQSAQLRAFLERLFYPLYPFGHEKTLAKRSIPTLFFYSMIASPERAESEGYMVGIERLRAWTEQLLMAPSRLLMAGNAMHQADYTPFGDVHYDVEQMRKVYEKAFPADCEKAFNMGKEMAGSLTDREKA